MDNPRTKYTKKVLVDYIEHIEAQISEAKAEIKRLSEEMTILSEELERERQPKMDER